MTQADIGMIGLGVMGQNLALNIRDHGFKVVVYNRRSEVTRDFITKNQDIIGAYEIAEFVATLKKPRRVMIMIKAGAPVDQVIEQLLAHLDAGDVIIEGGNSFYQETNRRTKALEQRGIHYLGTGISGGEEGARGGPSIMPGGHQQAWALAQPLLQAIAAQVDGVPCCQWVGEQGAGHYVKMVHNGIEYGDIQLIGEAYQLLRQGLGLAVEQIQHIFAQWNQGVLDSYLIEITSHILTVRAEDGSPLIDKILDTAGQKGTGLWTSQDALALGVPLTLISEAVFARYLSSMKTQRVRAAQRLNRPSKTTQADPKPLIDAIHDGLYAAKIISYAQGFMLMRQAAQTYQWHLRYGDIALLWRGGCIIRSRFLNNIKQAFDAQPHLENLLLDDFFAQAIQDAEHHWRQAVTLAIELSIPVPAMSSALAFYDGYHCAQLPANLLQAQRDYFGAHTYERVDKPRGEFFHTDWIGLKA